MRCRAGHNEFIAREALIFVIPLLSLSLIAWLKDYNWISAVLLLLVFCVSVFFRNPERYGPADPDAILSSADGKVTSITPNVTSHISGKGPYTRVSVFMSVFNVHVNRWPSPGKVTFVKHLKGSFLDAREADSSIVNERNAIVIDTPFGNVEIVQIAGKIARRIACWARVSDEVMKGERLGLIRFGSRVDVYIPPGLTPVVTEGNRVKAGITVLARSDTKLS